MGARSEVQAALGAPDASAAVTVMERIYQTGQSAGITKAKARGGDGSEMAVESEKTARLFGRMQKMGLKPPTHSADGLPKKAARFGYGQIERMLDAIEKGDALPESAQRIAAAAGNRGALHRLSNTSAGGHGGALTALGFDTGGYYRCGNCGRFASQKNGHTCPMTASSEDVKRMLSRRAGLPASAFEGYQKDALGALLEEARGNNGEVTMLHALTGRRERVTLDGLPEAMRSGFIPEGWEGMVVPVITDEMNVVGVLNAEGLTRAVEHMGAVQTVAQYYGAQIPPNAPVMNAYRAVSDQTPLHKVTALAEPSQVEMDGGQTYDLGHFIGTEYRKADAKGEMVEVGGKRYAVYARSQNPQDKSSARGKFATDTDNIVIGRTLPAAIGILAEGSVMEAGGKTEVYDSNGALLAVYDPSTNTSGDTRGSINASAEQMAAILAHRMANPATAYDYALITDFAAFKRGNGSPIAAADSGYLSIRAMLEGGHLLQMGAGLGVGRCPQCGQFIGTGAHQCPAGSGAPLPAAASPAAGTKKKKKTKAPKVKTISAAEFVSGNYAAPDKAQLHPEETIPQISVVRPEELGDKIDDVVTQILNATLDEPPAATQPPAAPHQDETLSQLAALLAAQQASLAALAQQRPAGLDEEKLGAAIARNLPAVGTGGRGAAIDVEKLGESIARAVAKSIPAPVVVSGADGALTAARSAKCPRCGQFMSADHQCPPRVARHGLQRPNVPQTEAEKALDGITMPAPDLYLDSVPAEWGGNLAAPLPENVPDLNTDYEMGQQERTIFNMIALQLRKKSKRPTNRAFGLYGPAGTGKNTIARAVASSLRCDDGKQGLPYYETNITPDADINAMIGEVVLVSDENGNTVSRVRLGPIGKIAASGGVAAINEIVRSPKLATALQSIIEDGEISIPTPEGGTYKVPVHPSAIFFTTWNPGYEGDADRPAQAFLSRITALPLEYPGKAEQINRVKAHFRGEGLPMPSDEILDASVNFWNELRLLTGGTGETPQIGAYSATPTTPGPRELARFVEYGTLGDWNQALLAVEVILDQHAEFKDTQKAILRDRFTAHFGDLASLD